MRTLHNNLLSNISRTLKIGCILTTSVLISCGQSAGITGAGSSFVHPAMSAWTKQYNAQTNIQINYQAIGSGGGIKQFEMGTVNFAATDEPLKKDKITQIKAIQFPILMGGIVPIYNIKGVKNLTLDGPTLAGIYADKIQYWDDVRLKNLNPGTIMPHTRIYTVHRSDGSGTTFNFTNYLSKMTDQSGHPIWTKGFNTMVGWPGKTNMGAKGNAGIASQVQRQANSIGYVEYEFAISNKIQMASMYNKQNKLVYPNLASFKSAAKHADWNSKEDFYQLLTNQPGANSWPIVATTFILLPKENIDPKNQNKTQKTHQVIDFIHWIFQNGDQKATQLNYITLPASVQNKIMKYINNAYPIYLKK